MQELNKHVSAAWIQKHEKELRELAAGPKDVVKIIDSHEFLASFTVYLIQYAENQGVLKKKIK